LFQEKNLIEKIDVIRLELKEGRRHVKIKDPGILKKKEYNLTEYLA